MFKRRIFGPDLETFRHDVAAFLDAEVTHRHPAWASAAQTPRDIWQKAGDAALLGRTLPLEFGGKGRSFLDSAVVIEELALRRISGLLTFLQSDIIAPLLLRLGTPVQKQRWLPGLCAGTSLGAIAMTEPRSGSDIQSMQTRAERQDNGFCLNGEKTHISFGTVADFVIVAAQSAKGSIGNQAGISLLLVETPCKGVARHPIAKAAVPALDTGHLVFTDCHVPSNCLLGAEGMGFIYLMTFLTVERLALAIYSQAFCRAILRDLVISCQMRKTAAGTLLDFQSTRFRLADLFAEASANQAYIDQCIIDHVNGTLDPQSACVAKLRTAELVKTLSAVAVQLRGANGVSGPEGAGAIQDLVDGSVQSLWGGTSEIMRDIIGRSLAQAV